jgi:hypothetical protein
MAMGRTDGEVYHAYSTGYDVEQTSAGEEDGRYTYDVGVLTRKALVSSDCRERDEMEVKATRLIKESEGMTGRSAMSERRKHSMWRKAGRDVQRRWERKQGSYLVGMKEYEVIRTLHPQQRETVPFVGVEKRLKDERERVVNAMNTLRHAKRRTVAKVTVGVDQWMEQVVRVGTGYRVRRDDTDPRKRLFDVGYSDVKEYRRVEGLEVKLDQSNMGRTVIGKGHDARVKVMNAVAGMEQRRPVSVYTGSGIMRKSHVGKLKLKSTKAGGKE